MSKVLSGDKAFRPDLLEPGELQPGELVGMKVVAVMFEFYKGWCAYMGPINKSDAEVMSFGSEVPEKAAKILFPQIAATKRIYGNV